MRNLWRIKRSHLLLVLFGLRSITMRLSLAVPADLLLLREMYRIVPVELYNAGTEKLNQQIFFTPRNNVHYILT